MALELLTWQLPLIPKRPDPSNYSPVYTKEELDTAPKWGFSTDLGGPAWLVNEHGKYFFPQNAACQAIREAHQETHYGKEFLYNWLVGVMITPGMKNTIGQIVETCLTCTMNNPKTRPPRDR